MADRPKILDEPETPEAIRQMPDSYLLRISQEEMREGQQEIVDKLAVYEARREKVIIDEIMRIRQTRPDLQVLTHLESADEQRTRAWEILQSLNDVRRQMERHGGYGWTDIPERAFPPEGYAVGEYEYMWLEDIIDIDSHLRDKNVKAYHEYSARVDRRALLSSQNPLGRPEGAESKFADIDDVMRARWEGLLQKVPIRDTDEELRSLAQKMARPTELDEIAARRGLTPEEQAEKEELERDRRERGGSYLSPEELAQWHRVLFRDGAPSTEYEYCTRGTMEIMRLAQPAKYLYHLEVLDGEENFIRYQNIASKKVLKMQGSTGDELEISEEDEAWYARQQSKLETGLKDGDFNEIDMEIGEYAKRLLAGESSDAIVQRLQETAERAARNEGRVEHEGGETRAILHEDFVWVRDAYSVETSPPTDYAAAWRKADEYIDRAQAFAQRVGEGKRGRRFDFDKWQGTAMSGAMCYEMAWRQLDGAARLAGQEVDRLEAQLRALKASGSPDPAAVARLESAINDQFARASASHEKGIECLNKGADILRHWTGGYYQHAWSHQAQLGMLAKQSGLALHDLRVAYAAAREGTLLATEELYLAKRDKVDACVQELAALDARIKANRAEERGVSAFAHVADFTDLFDARDKAQAVGSPIRAMHRQPWSYRMQYDNLIKFYHLRAERRTVMGSLKQAIREQNIAQQELESARRSMGVLIVPRAEADVRNIIDTHPAKGWPYIMAGNRRLVSKEWWKGDEPWVGLGDEEADEVARAGGGGSGAGGSGRGPGGGGTDGPAGGAGDGSTAGGDGTTRWASPVFDRPERAGYKGLMAFLEDVKTRNERSMEELKALAANRPKLDIERYFQNGKYGKMWSDYASLLQDTQDWVLLNTLHEMDWFMHMKFEQQYQAIATKLEAFRAIQKIMPDVLMQYFLAIQKGELSDEQRQYFADHGIGGLLGESIKDLVKSFAGSDLSMMNKNILDALNSAFGLQMVEKWLTGDPAAQVHEEMKEHLKIIHDVYKTSWEQAKLILDAKKTSVAFEIQNKFARMIARRIAIATAFGGFGIGPGFMAMNGLGQSAFNQINSVAMRG